MEEEQVISKQQLEAIEAELYEVERRLAKEQRVLRSLRSLLRKAAAK